MNIRQHPRKWLLHILEIHFHSCVYCFTFQCNDSASVDFGWPTCHLPHEITRESITSIGKVELASRVWCCLITNGKVYHYSWIENSHNLSTVINTTSCNLTSVLTHPARKAQLSDQLKALWHFQSTSSTAFFHITTSKLVFHLCWWHVKLTSLAFWDDKILCCESYMLLFCVPYLYFGTV